jgi:hypothetical protein
VKRLLLAFALVGSAAVAPLFYASGPPASGAGDSSAFSQSETVTRDFDVNGTDSVVDSRNFSVSVDQTANLIGRQDVTVSWTGAHPTGGIATNQNSISAQYEEYPVVLLECRGVDSASPPAGQSQLSPETCWTSDWSERYQQAIGDTDPPWRLDEYASSADTQAIVGQPSPLPASCTGASDPYAATSPAPGVQYWLPWVAADGTVYDGGDDGCAGSPPEADDTSALPSNETFGVTGTNGSGSAQFDVFDSQENQTLGCSTTVECSLVVVPIMGVSCNVTTSTPAADVSACEDTGYYPPGADSTGDATLPQTTVTGSLWWSASNWRNRIAVPLSLATTSAACNLTGATASNSLQVFGSELLIRATSQWSPYFCLGDDKDGTFSFVHVQTGEPEARNLVASGGADGAFTELPQTGGYPQPTVNAPVAMTGFSIAYSISGTDGQNYTNLKLTPLLLAKLLTESYPDIVALTQAAASTGGQVDMPALANNPYNITEDPEFEQLNPGIPVLGPSNDGAAELMSLSSDSDVMEALTTYINDDPSARAWLDGKSSGEPNVCNGAGKYQAGATDACPAMTVNPAYKGIQLPVNQWPLLTGPDLPGFYTGTYLQNFNPCLASSYPPGVAYLNQVASPVTTLEGISQNMQFDEPNSEVSCQQIDGSTVGEKLVADPRQGAGNYFMLGVTPLADNAVYGLQAAELQTSPGNFVGPTTAALQATASLLQPDASTGTWPIPYNQLETSAGQSAYPGTMIVYAAVPTAGLPSSDAADLGEFLDFAATTGQEQGTGVGQLPAGYLPLTQSNGLGSLAAYTQEAAADVAAQNGQIPTLPSGGSSSTSGSNGSGSNAAGVAAGSGTGQGSSINGAFPFENWPFNSPFGDDGSSSTAGASKKAGDGSAAGSIMSLLPLAVSAYRIQGWISGIGGILTLCLCLAGLVLFPLGLVMGRRRGHW